MTLECQESPLLHPYPLSSLYFHLRIFLRFNYLSHDIDESRPAYDRGQPLGTNRSLNRDEMGRFSQSIHDDPKSIKSTRSVRKTTYKTHRTRSHLHLSMGSLWSNPPCLKCLAFTFLQHRNWATNSVISLYIQLHQ